MLDYLQERISRLSIWFFPFVVVTLLLVTHGGARAQTTTRYVAPSGADVGACLHPGSPCRSVQYAVDQAQPGDLVAVAAGTYTGVHERAGHTQVLYLSQPVTISGGYDPADWLAAPDPTANPTTLDAGGQGRVLYIAPSAAEGSPGTTVEGLRISGGDATGLGGHGDDGLEDSGGGIYVDGGSPTIRDCVIRDNLANTSNVSLASTGPTGGVERMPRKKIEDYAATSDWHGRGGGVYLHQSAAVLTGNTIERNQASSAWAGLGGGLYLWESHATLTGNTIRDNVASTADEGLGGGLYLWASAATLADNTVLRNIASTVDRGGGGGLRIYDCDLTLRSNQIVDNVASMVSWGYGGGAFVYGSAPLFVSNWIQGNSASVAWYGLGGGLYALHSAAVLEGNTTIINAATLNPDAVGQGGGLWLGYTPTISLTNNLVAGNYATSSGSGVWLGGASWSPTSARLVHNTLTNNTGSGQGLYVDANVSADLINTIVSGHASTAIVVANEGEVRLEATLWNDNGATTGGEGLVFSHADYTGDPAFVRPLAWDYHVRRSSAAIGRGVQTGVRTDFDGHLRDGDPDIGADEYMPHFYFPLVFRYRQ